MRLEADSCSLFWTGAVCLGWCLEARTSLAAVLVFNLLVGLGSGPITALPTVYGQDLQPGKGGAVSASVCHFPPHAD